MSLFPKCVHLQAMIDHIHITNFRLFKTFELNGLKRVNLITGKNNTGKTVLLEALRLLAAPQEGSVYTNILAERGEFEHHYIEAWNHFFHWDSVNENTNNSFKINHLELVQEQNLGHLSSQYKVLVEGKEVPHLVQNASHHTADTKPRDTAVYLPFGGESRFPLMELWDKTTLTEYEDDVVSILKETIFPDLVRLDVKKERTLVRLKNNKTPVPLKSLGDGVQRLLLLAIALVNARNNFLLIDEIEVGLHHSALEMLWEKIFLYAQKWNIQVFVTTHSHDAVRTFTYVLDRHDNKDNGAYFRLQQQRKTGLIEAVPYSLDELEVSLESNLEPR